MSNNIQLQINSLREAIRHHDTLYYGKGISEISDEDYDSLYRQLVQLEKDYPHYVANDSPTQRVGSDLTKDFPKVAHSVPMMSIDNTYSSEDIIEWFDRIRQISPQSQWTFTGELKVDGIAVSLLYEEGCLVKAITRGNGVVGDEVTANVRTIRSIPLVLPRKESMEVRGEIYMSFENFTALNKRLVENGEKPMQNPRNTTAGTIKLLNSREVAARNLSFSAHYCLRTSEVRTHSENLAFLSEMGFPAVVHTSLEGIDAVLEFCSSWRQKRHNLGFPVDGVVIKVDSLALQHSLGATSKAPRWVIAFKYPPERATTLLEKIDCQVGRTGVVTPVARLKPVFIAGTTVKNATLHNFEEIRRLDLREGDTVEVEKGGEIIPKVAAVLKSERTVGHRSYLPPETCPSCGSSLVKLDDEVAVRCVNGSCPAQQFARLQHFVSRTAMDIGNIGPALLEQLLEQKMIRSVADLYALDETSLSSLERMGEKSAKRVVKAIDTSRYNSCDRLIHGLGIRMIGAQAAKSLAGKINEISDLYSISTEQLCKIEGVGPAMAKSIRLYFDQEENRQIVEQLKLSGVNCKGVQNTEVKGVFSGKTFVLTGTLSGYTRDEAKMAIEQRGGKVTGSVSKKTSFVLCGADPGSKYDKAVILQIDIIDEDMFTQMIKG